MKFVFLTHNVGRVANLLMTLHDFQALARSYGYISIPCVLGPTVEFGFRGTRKHFLSRYILLHSIAPLVKKIEVWPNTSLEEATNSIVSAFESEKNFALSLHDWLPVTLRGRQLPPPIVKRYFHPVARHWNAARKVVCPAMRHGKYTVGVHIRHGDFATFDGGKWFVDLETVVDNMCHFASSVAEANFVVCSDATFDLSKFLGLSVQFGPGDAVSDLSALCQCDFILKPRHSTFALWASWWANKPAHVFQEIPKFTLSDFQVLPLDPFFELHHKR